MFWNYSLNFIDKNIQKWGKIKFWDWVSIGPKCQNWKERNLKGGKTQKHLSF